MRKLITIILSAWTFCAYAQSLPADSLASASDVERFYRGCMKIVEAENTKDSAAANAAYAQAMDLLNTRSTASRKGITIGKMKVEIMDSQGLVTDGAAIKFAYDYNYARSRYKSLDFAPKGISRGFGKGCRVMDFVIAPGGYVKCSENVKGNCILGAIAQPGGKISIDVTASDGRIMQGVPYEDGMVGYAHWHNGDIGAVEYMLRNETDKEIVVTMFAN